MEKSSPNSNWELDFNINIDLDKNKPNHKKKINSIEVPDLILRDYIRFLKSKHIKID